MRLPVQMTNAQPFRSAGQRTDVTHLIPLLSGGSCLTVSIIIRPDLVGGDTRPGRFAEGQTVRRIVNRKIAKIVAPWLPWLMPGAAGTLDAVNVATPPIPLYMALFGAAMCITTTTLLCRRLAKVVEKAPVNEALLLGYRLRDEHGDQHGESMPRAVGEVDTVRLHRSLHLVPPPQNNGPPRVVASAPVPEYLRPVHLASMPRRPPQP